MVRERRPWERRSRQSFRGGETGAGRCRERSPGSLGVETPDFFTWVGRAAHGGHAVRTLSREGEAATVTRRRTDVPQWYQGAGMNGSDLEKNRDLRVRPLGLEGGVREAHRPRQKQVLHRPRRLPSEFYPKSVPLPEPESLPATDAILNGTCKSTYPRPRALAAIKNHKDWYAHQELVKARDVHVKNYPSLGDSAVNNREAARFVSASTPFAGKAFDVRVDGTYATAISSDTLQDELQRKLGLWLSAALPTLRVALERGMPVDFFGDYLYNKAHHRRPHDGVLAARADAMRAPANAPVVHGDKEKPELTRQDNEGYKTVTSQNPMRDRGGAMK